MKKKLYVFALASFFVGAALFADEASSLFFKMQDSYSSGFYPGVIRFADEILQDERNSIYFSKAKLLKAQSLLKMENANDALKILTSFKIKDENQKELNANRFYWLGRCYFELKNYDAASTCFYDAEKILKDFDSRDEKKLFVNCVYFSGKTEFQRKNYSAATCCFEFAIRNANHLSSFEYEDSAVLLVESLFLDENFKKAEIYATEFVKENFQSQNHFRLILTLANSLEKQKKNDLAYEYYSQLFNEDSSSSGKSQFWTQLAIEAFEDKDFSKSLSYFDYANKNASIQEKQIALLYRAEILFLTSKKDVVSKAKDSLEEINKNWKTLHFEEEKFYYEYAMLLRAKFAGLCGLWNECLEYASLKNVPQNLEDEFIYWQANAFYNLGEYSKALSLLEKKENFTEVQLLLLKANLLARSGKYTEANKIFSALDEKNLLDLNGNLDYAKSLLSAGYLESSFEQSQKSYEKQKKENALNKKQESQAQYLKAISLFNRKQWTGAEQEFKNSISKNSLDSKTQTYASFYLGYSQYQSAKYDEAYLNLKKVADENPNSAIFWQSMILASRAALQSKKYADALLVAKKAMDFSVNEEQKQESTFLTVGILTDIERYDEAISILEKHFSAKTDFAYQCKFLAADIMIQKKSYSQAQDLYLSLSKEKKAGRIAEDSTFRLGELLYSQKDYLKAAEVFESYIKNYENGNFFVASLYFAASCLENLGNKQKAILYYEQVAKIGENSTYLYPAKQKLEELSKNRKSISLLESKQAEYEKSGKNTTIQGRKIGTELCELYKQNGDSFAKIEKFASELLEIQSKFEGESGDSAKTAIILAEIYRNQIKNEKSANTYLMAAQFARKAGLSSFAERSLYGAVEAFDAAGLKGDASSTAKTLSELYPSSDYAKQANKLLKN
ncbi:tetratricopeptide repeat protein [Treponema pectinovorum]|uniref:tetratricopeptide repeat protein n=1 Tax=Treponema pectinovorum TaxID=164 RepID=UPI0011CC4931|nr:tetratricopeptide repeat protein [Treponema pectinovorum]